MVAHSIHDTSILWNAASSAGQSSSKIENQKNIYNYVGWNIIHFITFVI